MAKTKKELLEQLESMGVEVNHKSTISQLNELIAANQQAEPTVEDPDLAAAVNDIVAEQQPDTDITDETSDDVQPTVAKAGKRSAKALAEAEEKEAKQKQKAGSAEEEAKPKGQAPKTRPRVERRGKHFRKSAGLIEEGKRYTLDEAVELAKKTSHVKFDATVELHINLAVNPRHADQNIRDNLVLPAGTGKKVRVAVLTDDPATAKTAGADIAGTDELLEQLAKGVMDFDILISTPALMPKLGKHARSLGPRGLMPNPKSGTVTTDIDRAVAEAKAGRVEYRVDTTGIVHLGIGKVSFTNAQLLDNLQAVSASIKANKPQSVKGNYIKAIHLTTSMGPSIKIDTAQIG